MQSGSQYAPPSESWNAPPMPEKMARLNAAESATKMPPSPTKALGLQDAAPMHGNAIWRDTKKGVRADQYDAMRRAKDCPMPSLMSAPTLNVLWLRGPMPRLCAVGESSMSSAC